MFYIIQSGGLSSCSRKEGSISYRAEDSHDVVEKKVLYHTERSIVVMYLKRRLSIIQSGGLS